MCIATRAGFGISMRHILHEWRRLGVGGNSLNLKIVPFFLPQGGKSKLKIGPFCVAQRGQSGGRVRTLSGGEEVVGSTLKARVGELSSSDDDNMVGIL